MLPGLIPYIHGQTYAGLTNANACGIFPVIIPSAEDNWSLSELGPSAPAGTKYLIENGFIRYTVNGSGTGALGNGNNNTVRNGLMFDPLGTGNYGDDDYIQPGSPWEAYAFVIDTVWYTENGGITTLGGSNSSFDNYLGTLVVPTVKIWQLAPNHVVISTDTPQYGIGICQYLTLPGEPIIRMRMSFTNTTNQRLDLKIARGVDPDVDVFAYGSYFTQNQRGLDFIPETDIATSIGLNSLKPLSIYAPGNGFTHNCSVNSDWPTVNPNVILSGQDDGNGDYGICAAWDCGTIEPGETREVCCYYICGNVASDILYWVSGDSMAAFVYGRSGRITARATVSAVATKKPGVSIRVTSYMTVGLGAAPAYVPAGATVYADFVNENYYANGSTAFADIFLLQTNGSYLLTPTALASFTAAHTVVVDLDVISDRNQYFMGYVPASGYDVFSVYRWAGKANIYDDTYDLYSGFMPLGQNRMAYTVTSDHIALSGNGDVVASGTIGAAYVFDKVMIYPASLGINVLRITVYPARPDDDLITLSTLV